jgi:hypothetical protein
MLEAFMMTKSDKIVLDDQLMIKTVMVSEMLNLLTELMGLIAQKYFIKLLSLLQKIFYRVRYIQSYSYTPSTSFTLLMEISVPSNVGCCTRATTWVLVCC